MRRGFVCPRSWVVDGGAIAVLYTGAALLAVVSLEHATTCWPGCTGEIPGGENVEDG